MSKRVMFVFGTRPEAIKIAPIIRMAKRNPELEVCVCSTGQHREMLASVLSVFEIVPDFDFGLMKPGQTLKDITVAVLDKLTEIIHHKKPDWIVVQGDTTTAMAASLCGFYERIRVAHVEAGLRTSDRFSPFPEEFNRRVTALIADLHFAPTDVAAKNLLKEALHPKSVFVTGNTGIDALLLVVEKLESDVALRSSYDERFAFLDSARKMILVTVHRRESFGEPLRQVFQALKTLSLRSDVQLVIPLHPNPNVRAAAQEILGDSAQWWTDGQSMDNAPIVLLEPQQYFEFVYLMRESYFIISDSGGIQEEAPTLGKPVLVVRENTERPEAIEAGSCKLVGTNPDVICREANRLLDDDQIYAKMSRAVSPYGDGTASQKILAHMIDFGVASGRETL